MDEVEKLLPKQFQAIGLLASGDSITSVAEQLELSRKTVSGWMNQNAEFARELHRVQTEMFDDELRRLRGLASQALSVVYEGLNHSDFKIRFAAANKILSALNLPALLASVQSRPPEAGTPAELSAEDEQAKLAEILSGFDS